MYNFIILKTKEEKIAHIFSETGLQIRSDGLDFVTHEVVSL